MNKEENTLMTDEVIEEETVVEETNVETQPEVKTEEKTFTQEQVNSIVKKVSENKEEKANLTLEQLNSELTELKKERELEKAEKELREEISKKSEMVAKESHLDSVVNDKVHPDYVDNVKSLAMLKLNIENTTNEEIETIISEVIDSMPGGIEKGTSDASTKLNQLEDTNVENEEETAEGFYDKDSGRKLDMTQEDYDKLSHPQKATIIKK